MKVFQVLVVGDATDVDLDSALYDLSIPNPLFLSVAGAEKYVLDCVNESRIDAEEAPLPWLDWLDMLSSDDEVSEPRRRYYFEEGGIIYDIVTIEVQP